MVSHPHLPPAPRRGGRRGLRDLLGVVLSATVFTILLASGAGECGQRWMDVDGSRRLARADHLLQDMLDAVSAYPFEALARLGDPRVAAEAAAPDLRFDLGVTAVRNDLLRIEATLVDEVTSRQLGRFVTYRSRS